MPKLNLLRPETGQAIVTQVKEALDEERLGLAEFLGQRHSALVTQLTCQLCIGNLGPSVASPDVGAEVASPHESLASARKLDAVDERRKSEDLPKTTISWREDLPLKEEKLRESAISPHLLSEAAQEKDGKSMLDSQRFSVASSASASSFYESQAVADNSVRDTAKSLAMARTPSGKAKSTAGAEPFDKDFVIRRLQARIGYFDTAHILHADEVYACVESYSLAHFNQEQLRDLIAQLAQAFQEDIGTERNSGKQAVQNWFRRPHVSVTSTSSDTDIASGSLKGIRTSYHKAAGQDSCITFGTLVDVFLMDSEALVAVVGEVVEKQAGVLRDTLLANDANCLVAELLCLRVDDMSAPPPEPGMLEYFEPVVGFVIFLNGFLIGLQTDPKIANLKGMVAAELTFTVIFILELTLKLWHHGCREHFAGHERIWNWFDLLIIGFGVFDSVVSFLSVEAGTSSLTVIRLVRLTRLARLARIFRIGWLAELNLMVRGLIGGLKTLFWAVVLLAFMLYVIAVFLTMLVGFEDAPITNQIEKDFEEDRVEHFGSLGRSAHTAFRCLLIIDCTSINGKPLLTMATERYGAIVPVCYFSCFVVVSIGLMNLIMAIYIENTLREAKHTDEKNKMLRNRESLRVALQLKSLLLKMCAIQSAFHHRRGHSVTQQEITDILKLQEKGHMLTEDIEADLEISKEIFLLAILQPDVQQIMNDLDLPPERAHLFEVLDADASGTLRPTELINGLMKVRGEARRSDAAAPLLAVRALQNQVRLLSTQIADGQWQIIKSLDSFNPEAIRVSSGNFASRRTEA